MAGMRASRFRNRLWLSPYLSSDSSAPRLRAVQKSCQLRGVIARDTPSAAAVEEVFYSNNVKTALKLAHVRGVALLIISEAGLELGEYSPLEIKTSVVGYGRAEKRQVQVMVTSLLRLDGAIKSEDACDALAVAVCHATRRPPARVLKPVRP